MNYFENLYFNKIWKNLKKIEKFLYMYDLLKFIKKIYIV